MAQVDKPIKGIAVDAWCSGNPGPGGYRGVDISTGEILFKKSYPYITNNLAEFLAISHGIGYCKNVNKSYDRVFSDSEIAIAWVEKQSYKSGIELNKGILAINDANKSVRYLSQQKSIPMIMKWLTKEWGEIPADFNRKR